MIKFPKTPRLSQSFDWGNCHCLVQEKVDGANTGISFSKEELTLQSRGNILNSKTTQKIFEPMWDWSYNKYEQLFTFLGNRYILFGEWCYTKNRIWYNNLPDLFLAFDLYDKDTNNYISSDIWMNNTPSQINIVKTIWSGKFSKAPAFSSLIAKSNYQNDRYKSEYNDIVNNTDIGNHYSESETDLTGLMEGVYIRLEKDGKVIGRMKLPRKDFEKIRTDDSKWGKRPLFLNKCHTETENQI